MAWDESWYRVLYQKDELVSIAVNIHSLVLIAHWWVMLFPPMLSRNTFVLEYCGEVLDHKEFKARVKEYARNKNIHYYFMALKNDEVSREPTKKLDIERGLLVGLAPNSMWAPSVLRTGGVGEEKLSFCPTAWERIEWWALLGETTPLWGACSWIYLFIYLLPK